MEKVKPREDEGGAEVSESGEMTVQKSTAEKTVHGGMEQGSYLKFALMLATSFVIMYAVMFLMIKDK